MVRTSKEFDLSLGEHFVVSARKYGGGRCLIDMSGKSLSYRQALISSVAISEQICELADGQERIGILLPPSVGEALTNLAVALSGKVSVNLNYSGSEATVQSAIEQCGIKTIISSRKFAEKLAEFGHLGGLVFLEDIVKRIGLASKAKAYLKSLFYPARVLARAGGHERDHLATILFSSGSSGKPKGVMLSHNNIFSNTQALRKIIWLTPKDNLCAALPFFHSFGLTCGLWLPLFSGASSVYVPNPLDSKLIEKATSENKSTILFTAPTFLLNYIRRVKPAAFSNLRLLVVGAEKLKKSIADSFEEKFGIRPLEGYGATELSPAVSFNLTDDLSTGKHKVGHKEGTVGFALPDIEVKVVSVESGELLGVGEAGLLFVKGPNVMLGYLNKEEETAKVLRDGWYNTGDIASIDEDGFITLEGRLSRFSKIAGEMVPHVGIEEILLEGLGTHEQVVAVTSVPDEKRGEELVVLYLDEVGDAEKLHEIISKSGVPNIWKPKRENYVPIESMPLLGTGKLDVMQVQRIAAIAKKKSGDK
ncbi:MAG: AMP-binding protein [Planctomycetes bacterium]|nr:AMP-binding protein [Planctomycetota bacterium]